MGLNLIASAPLAFHVEFIRLVKAEPAFYCSEDVHYDLSNQNS